jgi:DNA uptake protein ComE-like DNA-binding protein
MHLKSALLALALATSFAAAPVLAQSPAAATQTRLNPNTATAAELGAVPHLTPALVSAIAAKKPFKTAGELNAVLSPALSKEQLAEVYPRLFVPINLNTASKADIGLIPGMTPKMVHEFEEYRPYSSLEQFNKEIGKYVPPAEVARLRSYVTLN